MNNVSLTGRLTREPELRYGGQDNSTAITRFTLAVDDGKDTDFINIKCFGRTAEWAQKWLSKGSRVEVTGKIKTGIGKNVPTAREEQICVLTPQFDGQWGIHLRKQA